MKVHDFYRSLLKTCIAHTLPKCTVGRPRCDVDTIIDSLFYLIKTGCQWRCLPSSVCGRTHFSTIHKSVQKYINAGVFHIANKRMLELYKLKHKPKRYCIDSTMIKNIYGRNVIGRNPVDRGRKGSKLSVIVDESGIVHGMRIDPANVPDVSLLEKTLQTFQPLTGVPLYGDKGYHSKKNSHICHKYKLFDRISRRRSKVGRRENAKRTIVENCFAWIDKSRRLILRYESHASTYMAYTMFVLSNRMSALFF